LLTKDDDSEDECKHFCPLSWTVKQYLCCHNFTHTCPY